jgi:hypothetical protein
MSESLQSAQQSLQQAGQQTAQNGQGQGQQSEASESEMGQEFKQGQSGQSGGQSGSKNGQDTNQKGSTQNRGSGRGGPGIGVGGNVGPQQPLPGVKKDELVKGIQDPRGKKLQRTYMGTPDPTKDRAAYYSIVPDKVRAAESTLNNEEIPVGYKNQVKEYFNSIQQAGK